MEQGLYRHVLDGILSYLRSHPLFLPGSSMWDAARLNTRKASQPRCGTAVQNRRAGIRPAGLQRGRKMVRRTPANRSPLADSAVIALDLSKDAVKCASRGRKRRLLAGFRSFPDSIEDNSIDCILNIFTPANYGEFQRILTDEGRILKVIPDEDHLRGSGEGLSASRL